MLKLGFNKTTSAFLIKLEKPPSSSTAFLTDSFKSLSTFTLLTFAILKLYFILSFFADNSYHCFKVF
ncbi:hypothetical protein AMJ47_04115 [Parcubacteria bacterium DG_72]|nr:MAG: hypothetical protein AMJ47_04115 [Parcubacteria bacterium DG_72]